MDEVAERATGSGTRSRWRQSDHEGDLIGWLLARRAEGSDGGRDQPGGADATTPTRSATRSRRAASRDRGAHVQHLRPRGVPPPLGGLARSAGPPSPASEPVAIIWRWRRCRGSPAEDATALAGRCDALASTRCWSRACRTSATSPASPDRTGRCWSRRRGRCSSPTAATRSSPAMRCPTSSASPTSADFAEPLADAVRRSALARLGFEAQARHRAHARTARGAARRASSSWPLGEEVEAAAVGEGRRGARRCSDGRRRVTDQAFEDILELLAVGHDASGRSPRSSSARCVAPAPTDLRVRLDRRVRRERGRAPSRARRTACSRRAT